jgi:hypothetical protein
MRNIPCILLLLGAFLLPACGRDNPQNNGTNGSFTDGGAPVNSGGGVIGCSMRGQTQSCCGTGTMTCAGDIEFPTFGPCLSPSGTVLSCCIPAEFQTCAVDAGSSSGSCMPSEFTTCDGGAAAPSLCTNKAVNTEPGILVGYAPANGQSVGANGQIKVWVNDEGAPIIAPGEQVDPNTGTITMPGDRTAKAADGYLWEPALYIAPQSAENGGTPHFPTAIKGSYNNTTVKGPGMNVPGMDPPPPGSNLMSTYTGEDIWDVSSLGLGPGVYTAEFVIHDGDRDRAVGCVTIQIQ